MNWTRTLRSAKCSRDQSPNPDALAARSNQTWLQSAKRQRRMLLLVFSLLLAIVVVLAYAGFARDPAGTHSSAKAITMVTSPENRFEFFCHQVVPILDRRCGNCHGVTRDAYGFLEKEPSTRVLLRWITDESGRIVDEEHLRLAYDRCTTDRDEGDKHLKPIDHANPVLASPLLRDPLATTYSGNHHPEVFAALEDPDLVTLSKWISLEIAANPHPSKPLTGKAERFFANNVVPILNRKTCFGSNCHGQMAFMDLRLDSGIPALTERFTTEIHRANHQAMLGEATRLVNLVGDVEQSKQLLKNIPVGQGGILHKGGNHFFTKGDPDYQVLKHWLELESADKSRRVGFPIDGRLRGIVFVRRPPGTPERFFEDTHFLPGGDLFWSRDGKEVNLTAALHPNSPADIRAPSVSYDATRVAFAMRCGEEEPFNIWELQLESGIARQLTFSTDADVHFLEPLYVPDPDDESGNDLTRVCLVMTSNVAQQWCQSSPDGYLGEAEEGSALAIIDHQLTQRAGTFADQSVQIVRGTNVGEQRRIVRHEPGILVVDRPFSQACDSTTHYVISTTSRMAPKFDGYRMRVALEGNERDIFHQTLQQMSFSASQIRRPSMRSTGEIVFTALRTGWQDSRPLFNGTLFRTHVDGSNVHIHNGSRSGVPIFADNRELPNGLEIRIGRDADSWWGGMLMLSDHQFGPSIEPDNPLDNLDHPYQSGTPNSSQQRFFPGWVSLDEKVRCRGVSPGGVYRDPYPLPDGSLLVAFAKGPLDLDDPNATPNFDILKLTPDPAFQAADGTGPGSFKRQLLIGGSQSELWPRPVVVRLKEPVHKKLKLQEDLFGPPTRVRDFVGYPAGTPAVLKLFDLPLLDSFFEQIAPTGQHHLAVPQCPSCGKSTPSLGHVRSVRLIGSYPQHEGDIGPPDRFMIAEIPLAEDGSFYAELPSKTSFDVQSLNSEGMALRSPHRWLYCHPGEQHTLSIPRTLFAQTCSGCHGGFTGNSVDTLRRPDVISSASRTLAIWNSEMHRQRLPANHTENGPRPFITIDFEEDIRPILESKCVSCHSQKDPAAALDLSGENAFDALRSFVEFRESLAIKSYLIEKLYGRELHALRVLVGDTPHPSGAPLSKSELRTLIRWIDLGASRRGVQTP